MVGRCKVRPSERTTAGSVDSLTGPVIVDLSRYLFCRLNDSVRIRVAEKKALELYRLCIACVSQEHNPAASFADDANATPDSRLHNQIRDITLCARESLQPALRGMRRRRLSPTVRASTSDP